jgi:predicted transcriptional regulator
MQDPALRGNPRELYVYFHERLDVLQYRAVKHSEIGSALRLEDSSVAKAIARLLDCGYIERGAKDGQVCTYRLIYSKLPAGVNQLSA